MHNSTIDFLAILPKSLNRTLLLYIFIHEARLSGVRASITIVTHSKILQNVMKCRLSRFVFRIAKRYIALFRNFEYFSKLQFILFYISFEDVKSSDY